MKKAVFLLAVFVLLKPIFPVLDYVANHQYIAKELCINKENTIIGCDGKCYLVSQLAKASELEKPISSNKKITVLESEVLFFQEIKSFETPVIYFNNKKTSSQFYQNLYSDNFCSSVFHPPTIS